MSYNGSAQLVTESFNDAKTNPDFFTPGWGQIVLAANRNGGMLRLIASRHDNDDDDEANEGLSAQLPTMTPCHALTLTSRYYRLVYTVNQKSSHTSVHIFAKHLPILRISSLRGCFDSHCVC